MTQLVDESWANRCLPGGDVMLDPTLWLAVASMAVTGLAAIGTKVLSEFSRHDLEMFCRRKNRRKMFDEVLERHEDFAVAAETLQVIGSVVVVLLMVHWLCPEEGLGSFETRPVGTVAATTIVLLLVLTTWIPWAVVRVWSAPFLYHTWPFWILVAWIMWPLTLGERLVEVVVRRLAGHEESEEDEEEAFEDEIRTIVTAGLRDGLLEADAREMIEGVIELGDVEVAEIMTPRSEVDALNVEASWQEMLTQIAESGRTRMPVYEGSLDNVLGILFVKDLLAELCRQPQDPPDDIRKLLRKPWLVPESKRVDDLLREFRRTRSHMAIVVDEYRAVAGVVTIEDALEEIVGEIADESDTRGRTGD